MPRSAQAARSFPTSARTARLSPCSAAEDLYRAACISSSRPDSLESPDVTLKGNGHAMSGSVIVRVHALDPISESGILAQLRECPDIRVADDSDGRPATPSVALAVIDLAAA